MPKFRDLVSSLTDATGTGIILNHDSDNNQKKDPITELLGDTKRELDSIIRQHVGMIQVIGAKQELEQVSGNEATKVEIFHILNQQRDNRYGLFVALNDSNSEIITQNSIRQNETPETVEYKLGNRIVGLYNKQSKRYSILEKDITVKTAEKHRVREKGKKMRIPDPEKSQQLFEQILHYISDKTKAAREKTITMVSNDKHFQHWKKRVQALQSISPNNRTNAIIKWTEPGDISTDFIVKSAYHSRHKLEQRELDDNRPIFNPKRDTVEFFDFDAYLGGNLLSAPGATGYTLSTYDRKNGNPQKRLYPNTSLPKQTKKHLHLESLSIPRDTIAKITIHHSNPTTPPEVYYVITGDRKQYELLVEQSNAYSALRQKTPAKHQ